MTAVRAREITRQSADRRQVGLHREDLRLVRVFIISEEEETILDNRTAEREARIAPCEEWVGTDRIALQPRICRHVVIAEKVVSGTVKVVAARAGDDINRTDAGYAGREVEVVR